MEYYVIYDKNDNLIAYCENIDELSKLVDREKKILKFRFKTNDFIYLKIPNLIKVYKFF